MPERGAQKHCKVKHSKDALRHPNFIDQAPGGLLAASKMHSELAKLLLQPRNQNNAVSQLGMVALSECSAGNQDHDMGAIVGALCDLAKDSNVPMVLSMQINCESEKQSNKRLSVSQIKDGGDVKQDCDMILTLCRDEVCDPDAPDVGTFEISVVKNPKGERGTCKAHLAVPGNGSGI